MAVPVADLQSAAPSAVIELFELELNVAQHGVSEVYRFHAGVNLKNGGDIIWAGNSYLAFPVEADGFEYTGNGQLPRPKIRCSNVMGSITAILATLPSGLEGAKVTRIRTLARYMDANNFPDDVNPYGTPDPTAEFPREIYYIDRKTVENRDLVEFELAAAFDLAGVRGPKRQCIANICQWKYRSTECGYTAAAYYDTNDQPVASASQDVSGKRLSSCETRFDLYTRQGSVTSGSNVLTMASTLSILPGEPVRGWGLPTGTTVSAILSSTTLRLSNNATANSSVTVSGTPSGTGDFMTVTSSAGLSVGMTANGPLMNGATITSIAGNTLTLSQRPYSIVKQGIIRFDFDLGSDWIEIPSGTAGITVGMNAFGSFGVNKPVITVEPFRVGIDTITTIKDLYQPVFAEFESLADAKRSVEGRSVVAYFVPASPSSSSYTFSGNQTYSFRDAGAVLPFGSYPGVGTYSS